MALSDTSVITLSVLLAAGAIFYGCVRVPPGSLARWLVYGAGAVVVTQFAWYPIVSVWCTYPVTTLDQYAATVTATVLLKVTVEGIVPFWLREIGGEESDDREPLQPTG